MHMKAVTENRTEVVGGKEYPLAVTRRRGPQEVKIGGEQVRADKLVVFDSPLGRAELWSRSEGPPAAEGERAANLAKLRAAAREALESAEME